MIGKIIKCKVIKGGNLDITLGCNEKHLTCEEKEAWLRKGKESLYNEEECRHVCDLYDSVQITVTMQETEAL